jgi:outer membrane protein TolC
MMHVTRVRAAMLIWVAGVAPATGRAQETDDEPAAGGVLARTLTLQEALAAARTHPALEAARARRDRAGLARRRALATMLPTFTAQAAWTFDSNNVGGAGGGATAATTALVDGLTGAGGLEVELSDAAGSETRRLRITDAAFLQALGDAQQGGGGLRFDRDPHELSALLVGRLRVLNPRAFPLLDAAAAETRAADRDLAREQDDFMTAVAATYLRALAADAAVDVARRHLDAAAAHFVAAQARVAAGVAPRTDRLQAELAMERARRGVAETRTRAGEAQIALAALAGGPPPFALVRPPPEVLAGGGLTAEDLAGMAGDDEARRTEALGQRPDLTAAAARVETAEELVWETHMAWLPTLNLEGRARWTSEPFLTQDPLSFVAVVSLDWLLWDGGLREADGAQRQSELREARGRQEAAWREAVAQAQQGRLRLVHATADVARARREAELAHEHHDAVARRYAAGAATSLDVVDAGASLFAAEVAVVQSDLTRDLAVVTLAHALGRGVAPPDDGVSGRKQ